MISQLILTGYQHKHSDYRKLKDRAVSMWSFSEVRDRKSLITSKILTNRNLHAAPSNSFLHKTSSKTSYSTSLLDHPCTKKFKMHVWYPQSSRGVHHLQRQNAPPRPLKTHMQHLVISFYI